MAVLELFPEVTTVQEHQNKEGSGANAHLTSRISKSLFTNLNIKPQQNIYQIMNAIKLLDEVFKTMTTVGPAPTLSETNKAYLKSVTILETALLNEYEKGVKDGIKEIENNNVKKQQNQN